MSVTLSWQPEKIDPTPNLVEMYPCPPSVSYTDEALNDSFDVFMLWFNYQNINCVLDSIPCTKDAPVNQIQSLTSRAFGAEGKQQVSSDEGACAVGAWRRGMPQCRWDKASCRECMWAETCRITLRWRCQRRKNVWILGECPWLEPDCKGEVLRNEAGEMRNI